MRQCFAISTADVGSFIQTGQGNVGRNNDPILLELKAKVNDPEMPAKKQIQGNNKGLGKSECESRSRNLCTTFYFCVWRSDTDFSKVSKQENWVSASKIRAECEFPLCLRERQSLRFGLSPSQDWENPCFSEASWSWTKYLPISTETLCKMWKSSLSFASSKWRTSAPSHPAWICF